MTSLARIREDLEKTHQQEDVNIAGESDTGSTSDFDASGRQKYVQLMTAIGLVGTNKAKNTLEMLKDNFGDNPNKIGGYWCFNCEYFMAKYGSPTGYQCQKFLFPDNPWECCNGWQGKE